MAWQKKLRLDDVGKLDIHRSQSIALISSLQPTASLSPSHQRRHFALYYHPPSTNITKMSDSSTASSVTRVSQSSPSSRPNPDRDDFYLRYLVAHQKQWLEFELLPNGKLRYANNSNFTRDAGMIRREVYLGPALLEEFEHMIRSSGIVHILPTTQDPRRPPSVSFQRHG